LTWQHAGSYPGFWGYHSAYIMELKLTNTHLKHRVHESYIFHMFNREVKKQDLCNYLKKKPFLT